MIINQSIGFAFIHIPKSAGTSLMQYLSPLNGPLDLEIGGTLFGEQIQAAYIQRHGLEKHSTLADAQRVINMTRAPREMFVFTFVRNPYARLSSIFSFLRKWESYNPELLRLLKSFADFREFVASEIFMHYPGPSNMFLPQCNWIMVDGKPSSSMHCFRIEDAAKAIKILRHELILRGADASLLPATLPCANISESLPFEGFGLSDALVEKINDYYAEDFKAFGYSHLSLP
ncbi:MULTISPECIES: sulfotransferase family 2 domain-containing protein [Aphanothece]|uniref:sulfotransferase family 2 domain-containing protein n=1 Tax=Aphanothece TaxID=1121 RepID=UPI0039848B20